MVGVASGSLCVTLLERDWWDLVWIGISKSEFTITHGNRWPFMNFESIRPISPLNFVRWSFMPDWTIFSQPVGEGSDWIGQVGVRASE